MQIHRAVLAALIGVVGVVALPRADAPAAPGSLKICSARTPTALRQELERLSDAQSTAMASGYHPELAALKAYVWEPGHKLHVRFMGGTAVVQQKVAQAAGGWTSKTAGNFSLIFDNASNAEIRVSFDPVTGSWSEIGMVARGVARRTPTMNFGWLDEKTPDEEYRRVVLHEFGHALGCIHEHQSPSANIKWNKKAVYDYYATTNRWDKAAVDQNIFFKYPASAVKNSKLDVTSIMMYAFPGNLTTDGSETGWNRDISQVDKDMIETLYPPQPSR